MRAETRHQLKQDRFRGMTIDAAEATVHWSAEHKSKLILGGIAAAVVIAASVGLWYYFNQQDEKASLELSQAVRTMNMTVRPSGMPAQADYPSFASAKERATEAHKQLLGIVNKYPHTRSGDAARFFLGVTAEDMGNNSEAEGDFKTIAGSSQSDFAALAKLALASVYRSGGRNKEAIDVYKQLIDHPSGTVGKATAQMQLAETYKAAQQLPEAKLIYAQIQKENPSSPESQLAGSKLQELK